MQINQSHNHRNQQTAQSTIKKEKYTSETGVKLITHKKHASAGNYTSTSSFTFTGLNKVLHMLLFDIKPAQPHRLERQPKATSKQQ